MTPDDNSIAAARKLVAEALARSLDEIPPDGSIETVEAWDSLGHVRVLLAIESAIGNQLPSDVIAQLTRVSDVAEILAGRPGGS